MIVVGDPGEWQGLQWENSNGFFRENEETSIVRPWITNYHHKRALRKTSNFVDPFRKVHFLLRSKELLHQNRYRHSHINVVTYNESCKPI